MSNLSWVNRKCLVAGDCMFSTAECSVWRAVRNSFVKLPRSALTLVAEDDRANHQGRTDAL